MDYIYLGIIIFIFCLAIFDLLVGVSNDAVNFLNSAIGAKAASWRVILTIAAIGVFVGASFSNGMMDVARHGIFQPQFFSFKELMVIMLAVMVTDVVLLDMFNSLGMPTSTTVSLVFEMLGGTVALAILKNASSDGALTFAQMINTDKVLTVILGIFLSIAIAFFFGAVVQYISRLIFSFNYKRNLKYFAGVFGGIAMTAIIYFMLIKGMKDASFMTAENKAWVNENTIMIVLYCFLGFTLLSQILHWLKVNIFRVVVLLGTFSLAMAFAGNDLVNFIGIPLTALASFNDFTANANGLGADEFMMSSLLGPSNTPIYFLLIAGGIMVFALVTSKKAQNVVKTSLDLSKQDDGDELFGTSSIARRLVRTTTSSASWLVNITPPKVRTWIDSRFNKDETIMEHGAAFDLLRASVNLVMAALLIAVGTSMKLPLSTTFVTFMVAMGTSLADRAWSRESAVFRVTGVISVIGGWFITAGAAFIISFLVALVMYYGGIVVMVAMVALAIFLLIRSNRAFNKKRKEENKDELFEEILSTKDKAKVWVLLNQHVNKVVADELQYVSDFYNKMTDCFFTQNRRCLHKLFSSLSDEKKQFKTLRRRELVALRKTDSIIAIQAGTWFHLTSNNASQLIYSLRRLSEPCMEHIDNNFNPLPKQCIDEFTPMRDRLLLLIEGTSGFVHDRKEETMLDLIKKISAYKKEMAVLMNNQLARIHNEGDTSNLNVYILYQSILQESQQMADTLKHLARAVYNLDNISMG